jgi:DNA polymerase III subunit delta'
VIGHQKILGDLKDLNDRGTLGHGYIFYGPAMVGKKLTAIEFANYLEDGKFEQNSGSILSDMMLVEPFENGSIGIDAVREIKNFLWQKPNASSRRTLIIDDAELATTEAQNALLKIAEEPPVSSLLILITSDIESILPTIASRLPKIYFGTVAEKEIAEWLIKSGVEKKKANETAKKAMGKPGLAWRLLNDEDFQEQLALAEKVLKSPATTRRDLIKKILEPEEFNFRKFLDAIILQLAWREQAGTTTAKIGAAAAKTTAPLWHKALALYDRETNFSLNPRLQIEALLAAG